MQVLQWLSGNWFFLLSAVLVLQQQESTATTPYCTQVPTTMGPNDPPMPVIPDRYQTVIEANIVGKSYTQTAYEYFDNPGDRATLQIYTNGTLHTLVFDYANDQLFYITGGKCETRDLKTDDNNVLFGNGGGAGIHVFSSAGALHFNESVQTYKGQKVVRGIQCDWWTSCLYWPQLKSNFTLDYYFTAYNWTDSMNYPQVPVRAMATGVVNKFGTVKNFTHYYDYVDFRPTLSVSNDIFETPNDVVCKNRKRTKALPQLPRFYHYRQEIISDSAPNIEIADVWYDSEYKIIRYDYRSNQPPLYTDNPVTEIHDFKFGVRYSKDQTTGRCVASAISISSFDVAANTTGTLNGSYALHMKDPMSLFFLDHTFAYTGQRTTRGLLCDVFTSIQPNFTIGGQKVKAILEYYFLADGLDELPDDGTTKPKHVPVKLDLFVPSFGTRSVYNFQDFNEEHPDLSLFDTSSCFSESAKLQFRVRFPGSYKTGTSDMIKISAQRLFWEFMNVSPVRVQDVRLDYDHSQIYISGTLLDRSPYLAQFTMVSETKINEAKDDLTFTSATVSNVSDCSKMCVTNTGFTCNSFEFCQSDPTRICKLSRNHIGDNGIITTNSTCDHFSRTVNGPSLQELPILQAYTSLETAVFSGGVEIDLVIPGIKNTVKYVAVDIEVTFGWLNPKPVPSLQGQFSYHLEITVPKQKAIYDSHIYYDYQYKLVRYDMVNNMPAPPFNVDPTSFIHDYNTGLAYTLDRKTGNCSIGSIQSSSFDVSVLQNAGYVVKMKSPLDIFYLNGTYVYAGQRTLRGMLCDVFEDKRSDFRYGGLNEPTETIFQFYFVSSGWNELSEDSGTKVETQPIALIVSSAKGDFTLTYNFYDFSEQHPDLSNFDIRSCFTGSQIKHFLIKFKGDYHPTLDTNLKEFQKNVQLNLAMYTQSSPLRFQDPQITYQGDYTYYLATMIEQAPVLLDFTFSPGMVVTPDKTIISVTSDTNCAALCRSETTIQCEGFNYCPSTKSCQLSKRRTSSATPGQSSLTCDHYSRTVNNTVPIEPTVDKAFEILRNAVYANKFQVPVHTATGSNVIYNAVLFDTNILRPDSQSTTSVNLQHFIPAHHKVILNQNDLELKGVSVDQCAGACLNQRTFDCNSFDYCFDTGVCLLSHVHPDRNQSLIVTHNMCDLYARTYLDSFTMYAGQTVQTQGDTSITNVASADLCAQKCANANTFSCKSFDYCTNSKTCVLKTQHILDMPKSAIAQSLVCSHYSRKYINDFTVNPKKSLNVGQNLQFSNISRDNCAKTCVDNSGVNCKAFTYCVATSTCTVTSVDPAQNQASVVPGTCDFYTRKYFPGKAPFQPPMQPQARSASPQTTGFTGGSMAGLAIGMFIPGMVMGAALLYFCRTKRLVREEQMRMGFVNMSHDPDSFDDTRPDASAKGDGLPAPHLQAYDTPQ